jgi:hypothetical protein
MLDSFRARPKRPEMTITPDDTRPFANLNCGFRRKALK